MTKVTFVGGPECGNIGQTTWPYGPPGSQREIIFPLNVPVEVTDRHILSKIRGQLDKGWWKLEDEPPKTAARSTLLEAGTGESDESSASGEEGSDESDQGSRGEAGTLRGSTRQRKHS